MGVSALLSRTLIGLAALVIGAGGLRVVMEGEDCSQPGIQCTIKRSDCFDVSWLQTFQWTPNAPSQMEVTVGIGQNELGRSVPLLQINWTISIDSSIQELQGVEILVLDVSTNLHRCIQFQFNEQFTSQVNPNGQPWQFYSNNFEVNPGQMYDVTVQHLPKQEGVNFKRQQINVPWCSDGDMIQTYACHDQGFHWFPNITVKHTGEDLTVEFTSRWDAQEYGVAVKVRDLREKSFEKVFIRQGPPVQRVQVTFPGIGGYIDMECVYNISVWPYMSSCKNDCVRMNYVPPCATEAPLPTSPPEPVKSWYLWAAGILLTITCCGGILFVLKAYRSARKGQNKPPLPPTPPPTPALPVRKKVWLVYSADNKHYVNVVISLTDFIRQAWGIDVVLDCFHVQEMAVIGPMAWLGRQKNEIEKTEGTILILCSRGVQEKWKVMQDVKEKMREDREPLLEDLCTPALSLIIPDFQYAKPYDRYVVAYFSSISTVADIPSLLEICPKYSLTENLQELFFRIQRQEQHQPHQQLTVSYAEHPSYQHLVKTIERCRKWQEHNPGWFAKECLITPVEDLEDTEEEEDVHDYATRKVRPVLLWPETSVSMVDPVIMEAGPAKLLDPTIVIGTPSTLVEPFLSDVDPTMSVVQPLLEEAASAAVCIQEPQVAVQDPSREFNRYPLRQEVSIHSDQGAFSIEQLMEAQKCFFQNSVGNPELSSALDFMEPSGEDLVVPSMSQPVRASDRLHEIFIDEQLMTPAVVLGTGLVDRHSAQLTDQGYSSWDQREMDLKAIEMESLKLLLQNEGHLLNFEQV